MLSEIETSLIVSGISAHREKRKISLLRLRSRFAQNEKVNEFTK